jgi:hypothetical protein
VSEPEAVTNKKEEEFMRQCKELAENIQDLCNLYPRGVRAVALLSAAGIATAGMDREFALVVFDSARDGAQEETQEGDKK